MNALYTSWHYSPAAIASAAHLYNFTSADISSASILEIGCRKGDSILRHAVAYPDSVCVGVDIDPERINMALKQAGEKALNNVHLYCLGLQDLLSVEVGKFDYIIIPSIYTMLDDSARSALINWCQRQLSDCGVIAVKWHTLPGARANKMLQQAIAFHSQQAQTEQAWLSSAKAMMSFMEMADLDGSLKASLDDALLLTDAELLAQYLEDNNDASLLTEFCGKVNAEQLRLLGDVIPQYEIARHYGEQIDLLQKAVARGKGALQGQQYLDFAVQRRERFSLLISQNSPQLVSEAPDLGKLATMHWAASYALTDDENLRINRYGEKIDTSDLVIRRILDWLNAAWPRSLSTEQILSHTYEPEKPEAHRDIILSALQKLYLNKPPSLYVSAFAGPYNSATGEMLKPICSFNEQQVAGGTYCARVNWWGEKLAFKREEFALLEKRLKIENEQDALTAIELAGKGLIVGNALSWARFWQSLYSSGSTIVLEGCLRSYLIAISPEKRGGMLSNNAERAILSAKSKELVNIKKARKIEALMNAGYTLQAKAYISEILDEEPDDITFILMAANAYSKCGEGKSGLKILGKRLSRDGNYPQLLRQIADILYTQDNLSATARVIFQYLLKLDEKDSVAWGYLSGSYNASRDFVVEENCLLTSLGFDESNSTILLRLSTLYSNLGRLEEAKQLCRKALSLPVSGVKQLHAQAMYLFILSHDSVMSAQEKFLEHVGFGRLASKWAEGILPPARQSRREYAHDKVRIGFLSGDLNSHPVHHFLYPIWESVDRTRFELYAYATGKEDHVSELYKETATAFRSVSALSEHELAGQIREDEIDILIDLSGFTSGNRLLTFALKPAPIQMSWIGFVGTTGLQEMDYYINYSALAEPGELDGIFTEQLISLPQTKMFNYYQQAPAINTLPALNRGALTLGNFNRPQKLTPAILDCWAEILVTLPEARLIFGFMVDEKMIEHYAGEMARRGVQREQLDFRLKLSLNDYMAMHNEVDLLLDSHPYSAGTTAQHALWMGVPLVTAVEGSAVSRTAAVTMKTLGLHEFVTTSLQEYVQKVVEMNGRYDHLNTLRLSMRERIAQREKSHSHNACYFEKMIETVWQRHLQGEAPSPLVIADEHRWDE